MIFASFSASRFGFISFCVVATGRGNRSWLVYFPAILSRCFFQRDVQASETSWNTKPWSLRDWRRRDMCRDIRELTPSSLCLSSPTKF
jgi:hypothetical protein